MSISKRRKSGVEPRPTGSKIRPTQRRPMKAATGRVRVNAVELARRKFLHRAAGAATLPSLSRSAEAQTYPTRSVRIVVGYPAGGVSDIVARLIGQSLSERLGQQFIIETRPGAGGTIGTGAVAHAPPDGYTLLMLDASAVDQCDPLR
jgi:Tripartite tricarboxylate transporter family receptor